jgi:peroxiredoxin
MFRKKITFLFALIIAPFIINAQLLTNLNINGSIENTDAPTIYLAELSGNTMALVDSASIDQDGKFQINTNIETSNFFQLTLGGEQYTILVLQPDENIYIELDANKLINPKEIKGSPKSELVYTMIAEINKFEAAKDSLNTEYQQYVGTSEQDSMGIALAKVFEKIEAEKLAFLNNSIKENPSLPMLLFVEQLDISEYTETYKLLDEKLYKEYPNNTFVKDIHDRLQIALKVQKGKPAPEISLPNPENEIKKLSELRGNIVLIDFWAAWCRPCREANPKLVKLYEKYNAKGFEILGVSLDKERSKWVKAIKDDGLVWTQVSDLRYWNSVAGKAYGVKGIPHTVLVDRDGNIIEVGLRGEDLENKLKEIFGE